MERKEISLSYDPDEWYVFVEGKIDNYPSYLITKYYEDKLLFDNYYYNLEYYADVSNDKKR